MVLVSFSYAIDVSNTYLEYHCWYIIMFCFVCLVELELGTQCVVQMEADQTILHHLER